MFFVSVSSKCVCKGTDNKGLIPSTKLVFFLKKANNKNIIITIYT